MDHNPHKFKVGDIVILDKDYNNSSTVEILSFTPNFLMVTVCEPGGQTE